MEVASSVNLGMASLVVLAAAAIVASWRWLESSFEDPSEGMNRCFVGNRRVGAGGGAVSTSASVKMPPSIGRGAALDS